MIFTKLSDKNPYMCKTISYKFGVNRFRYAHTPSNIFICVIGYQIVGIVLLKTFLTCFKSF